MDKVWPWVRSVVGLVLAVTAINLVHSAGEALFPDAYAAIDSDADRFVLLGVAMLAGTIACYVLGAIARHRLWLHMGLFLLLMLAIDVAALLGPLAGEPLWLKVLVIATLPLQVWTGGRLALLTWSDRRSASAGAGETLG